MVWSLCSKVGMEYKQVNEHTYRATLWLLPHAGVPGLKLDISRIALVAYTDTMEIVFPGV